MHINRLGSEEAAGLLDPILQLYRAAWQDSAFTENAEQFRDFEANFQSHVTHSDFRLFAAMSDDAGLEGFAYGYTSVPGGWWREMVIAGMHAAESSRWFADSLEVVELAVAPGCRRRGIGSRLHDELIASAQNRTAVLSTQSQNADARRLYEKRGWSVVLDGFYFPNRRDPYVIMGLELKDTGS